MVYCIYGYDFIHQPLWRDRPLRIIGKAPPRTTVVFSFPIWYTIGMDFLQLAAKVWLIGQAIGAVVFLIVIGLVIYYYIQHRKEEDRRIEQECNMYKR